MFRRARGNSAVAGNCAGREGRHRPGAGHDESEGQPDRGPAGHSPGQRQQTYDGHLPRRLSREARGSGGRFPGGGYHILAMDLEGTEVCEWLNSIGITAVLLKYRVPKREGVERYVPPLQDAQRALGMVRKRAKELGIDESKIGVLGFSAGAHLGVTLAAQSAKRTYEPIDAADQLNCRPDFLLLIYPGGLVQKDHGDEIAPEAQVRSNSPPAFLVMAADDPVRAENALMYALAMKKAGVPCELHIYPKGGHGYGLRKSQDAVTGWPTLADVWIKAVASRP